MEATASKVAEPNAAKEDRVIQAPRECVAASGLIAMTTPVMAATPPTVVEKSKEGIASRFDEVRTHLRIETTAMTVAMVRAVTQTIVANHPRPLRSAPTGSHATTRGAKDHWTPSRHGRFQNSRTAATETANGTLNPMNKLTQPTTRIVGRVDLLFMRSPSTVAIPEDGCIVAMV
jgi:hypothetical protein